MNKIPCFSTSHPETLDSEVYLGNFTQEDAMSIRWKTKRPGVKSYCVDGSDYPFQTEHGVLPYFADKRELSEAGLQWTTEQELENYRQQYLAGIRAMSKEELEKMALEQAKGMRQMIQSDDYRMRGMAQLSSSWPQAPADEQEKPAPLTRWQRFRRWLREVTR